MPGLIEILTPSVPRQWLLWCATTAWMGVGIGMCVVALTWVAHTGWGEWAGTVAGGVALGMVVCRLGFSRIARRNVERIVALPDRVCLFAFQAWRSYALILTMVTLGFLLRHSPLPRKYLALVYLTIGSGLVWCSRHYRCSPTPGPTPREGAEPNPDGEPR